MRRAELLQEVRKMRFEEIYGTWPAGRLTQEGASGYALRPFLPATKSGQFYLLTTAKAAPQVKTTASYNRILCNISGS